MANIDASVHKETKNSSNSKIYDELRLLSEEILKERVFKSKDQITNSIFIKTSEKTLNLKVVEIDVLEEKILKKYALQKSILKLITKLLKNLLPLVQKKYLDL